MTGGCSNGAGSICTLTRVEIPPTTPLFSVSIPNEYKTVQGEDKAELIKYLFESYLPIIKTDWVTSAKFEDAYLAVLARLKFL